MQHYYSPAAEEKRRIARILAQGGERSAARIGGRLMQPDVRPGFGLA
jgi:hypothetical protein